MAKNWTTAEAVKVIVEGKDKEAIQDIGRRFPLLAVASAGGAQGLLEIIGALPDHQTARKIESVLKAGIEEVETEEEEVEEKEEKKSKGKAKDKKKEKAKGKAKKEKEKPTKGKGNKKKEEVEEEEEDFEDEDEDMEEEDDGLEEMTLAQLRKHARKNKVDIEGLKSKADIIAAIRGEDVDADEDDEDEDDDDWDLD